jgi:hypothetical protein
MAGLSVSIAHGASGMKMSDFTAGTLTPNAGDVEVRWNTTDTNGKNVLSHEVVIKLREIIRLLEQGRMSATNPVALSGGAAPPPLT